MSQHGLYLHEQHDKSIQDCWNRDVCWRAAISSQLPKTFYQKIAGELLSPQKNHIENQVSHHFPELRVVHFVLLSLPRWLAGHGECEVFILLELIYIMKRNQLNPNQNVFNLCKDIMGLRMGRPCHPCESFLHLSDEVQQQFWTPKRYIQKENFHPIRSCIIRHGESVIFPARLIQTAKTVNYIKTGSLGSHVGTVLSILLSIVRGITFTRLC